VDALYVVKELAGQLLPVAPDKGKVHLELLHGSVDGVQDGTK
jgi:hypothetical protein